MAPTQSEQIKRLSAENAELASKVNHMEERVSKLEAALQAALETCGARHNEACIRVESVEENLCQLSEGQQELQYDQASLMLRLESQQMYSRKQTLLLTGSAVGLPTRGEDIRGIVLGLLNRYLGLTGLQPGDICACHRLKNPKVILVRFANLDHSEKVYRARTKPKLRGLLIFESLTTERLSVIDMLKALKAEGSPHVLSYYTQGGRIFVRTSEDREVRPIEIPFGLNQDQIKALCQGEQVSPTPIAVCDQFRAVNSASCPLQRGPGSKPNPWTLVTRSRRRAGPAGAPGDGRVGVAGGGRPRAAQPAQPAQQSQPTVAGGGAVRRAGVAPRPTADPPRRGVPGGGSVPQTDTPHGRGPPDIPSDPPAGPSGAPAGPEPVSQVGAS